MLRADASSETILPLFTIIHDQIVCFLTSSNPVYPVERSFFVVDIGERDSDHALRTEGITTVN